jgi:hypothetical protein
VPVPLAVGDSTPCEISVTILREQRECLNLDGLCGAHIVPEIL